MEGGSLMDCIKFDTKYKVTYPTHEMDTNPTIKYFAFEYEALDWDMKR